MVNCEIIDKRTSSFYIAGAYQEPRTLDKKVSMEETGADSQIIDLITQYQSKLFAYIYSQTTDPDATREILQETNIVIWRKREQFEFGTSFNAWSQSIAYFQIKAFRQKRRRDRLVFDDEVMDRMSNKAEELEEKHDIRKDKLKICIGKLKERYQHIVKKRYQDGISVNRIAEEEGIPANTVTQSLFRVRQKLIECVKKVKVAE